MENKKIILSLICCFLFTLGTCISCDISKKIERMTNNAIAPILSTVVITNQALVKSTVHIYEIDSLKSDIPFYIHQFNISFISRRDSFNLQLDSIEARWVKDSIMQFRKIKFVDNCLFYDELNIPNHNFHFIKDSIQINIQCKYLPSMNIQCYNSEFKYFTVNYNINNNMNLQLVDKEKVK